MQFQIQTVAIFLLASITSSSALTTSEYCGDGNIPVTVVSATAPNGHDLTDAFESFRGLLGGKNNGNDIGPIFDGHRQINWDADVVPFDMPGDFFASTVTRGLTVVSNKHEFRVSNADHDDLFNSINRDVAKDFQTFSPKRLFTVAKGDNVFAVDFSVPGKHDEATVEGFGAVFVDVDQDKTTTMTFLAESGCIIGKEDVKAFPEGLSFLGFVSESPAYPIHRVVVKLGNKAIDGSSNSFRGKNDIVVMDDFLYSEPQAVH